MVPWIVPVVQKSRRGSLKVWWGIPRCLCSDTATPVRASTLCEGVDDSRPVAFAAFSCLRDLLGRCTIDESRSFTISIDACMQRVRYALAEKAGSREQGAAYLGRRTR